MQLEEDDLQVVEFKGFEVVCFMFPPFKEGLFCSLSEESRLPWL